MIAPHFGFGPLEAELWRLVFVMTRIGAAMLAAPVFGATTVPVQLRVVMSGAVAVMVCAWHPVAAPAPLFTLAGITAVAGEVLVGLTLGFVLQLSFAAPVIAAELIGGTMGMSVATAVDPGTGVQSPALGQYYAVLLVVVFLGLGGHLRFLELVVESYAAFPPGQTWLGAGRMEVVAGFAASMFIAALAMALPVVLVLLVVQIVAGMLSRSAPALNLFSLGLPAGVLAGLAALIAAAPLAAEQAGDLVQQGLEQVAAVLAR